MNRKAVLIVLPLFALALGLLLTPVAANIVPPPLEVEGWAFVKLEDGCVCGPATSAIFIEPPHDGPNICIHLSVDGHCFGWVITDLCQRWGLMILKAEPCHGLGAPAPITVILFGLDAVIE